MMTCMRFLNRCTGSAFIYIYEHEGDPDEPCEDPSCPWRIMNVYKQKLKSLYIDPEQLLLDDWMSED